MIEKGNKKIIRGWVMYDWANSVYNLVISSAIFPIFYTNITRKLYVQSLESAGKVYEEGMPVLVDFFGFQLESQVLISYILSASFLVVSFLSPLLSGIADFIGNKKRFMQFFCYLGAFSTMALSYFENNIELGLIAVFLASIGFWNSLVFYNAYLPEIAEPEDHDKISARGFTMGYFGSMLLLIISLGIIMGFGPEYTKYCFILVGLWWIGFSQITYKVLPNNVYGKKREKGFIWKGFRELKLVFEEFRKTKRLKRYLVAFFFFNTGVQTVMLMAVYFAKEEINWKEGGGDTGLIISILLIQILGAFGAFLMARISEKIGNIKTLMLTVAFWIFLCLVAFVIDSPFEFYMLASGVGLVMGGVQALARSTYSKFLPKTQDHASYFSFYDVTEKVGIVLGTFFYGLMFSLTGDLRMSVLSIASFFSIGFLMLLLVPKNEVNLTENGQ